ncbi:MAG: hypothetical protein NC184_02665 [Roseburia sp.]|nr:hypothetical protein [Roseburia sp.]
MSNEVYHIISDVNATDILLVIFTILGTINAIVIGVFTVVNILKYMSKKRTDAIYGFYSQLSWLLDLLDKSIGLNENNKVNVLYCYSENIDLNKHVTSMQKGDFNFSINGIIDLLCRCDNQTPISSKNDAEKFNIDIKSLFNTVYNYRCSTLIFHKNDGDKKEIDEKAIELRKLIQEIQDIIEGEKNLHNK